MYSLNQVKTLVSCRRDPARSLPLWRGFLLIPLIVVCFALSPQAQAAPLDGSNSSPFFNTWQGDDALLPGIAATTGNSAFGWRSLTSNTAGAFNTAMGPSLILNTAGTSNTAVGAAALLLNTDGNENTAVGTDALVFSGLTLLSGADFNCAFGAFALFDNSDGFSNNAVGDSALFSNLIAVDNTAIGDVAAAFNDSDGFGFANNNVAIGAGALVSTDGLSGNIDGSENTAVGTGAGPNLVTGFNNTYIGDFVGTLADDEDSTIRIGDLSNGNGAGSEACFIGGIFANSQPVDNVTVFAVTIDTTNDHLGFDPGPNGNVPVLHRSAPVPRSAPQRRERPQAQHQAKNDKVEKLEATVAQQQKQIDTLTAQLKEQATQIQKVSAQLEMVRQTPRVVNNQ
jgi:uncharacterized coiled-coil protein SlyX